MPHLFNTSQSHYKKERVKKIPYTGGSDATQCCVQSQFAHRNSHTLPINQWQPIHCELRWLQHMVASSGTYIAENLEKSTTFKLLWNQQVCICCTNKREEEIGGKGQKTQTWRPRSPSPRIRSPSVTTITSTFFSGQFFRISRTLPLKKDYHKNTHNTQLMS